MVPFNGRGASAVFAAQPGWVVPSIVTALVNVENAVEGWMDQ